MTPLPAEHALAAYYLEARGKLLDLAAILDRIDRGGSVADPRLAKIRKAIELLQGEGVGRAEAIQQLFSLEYDPHWKIPEPR